MASHGDVAMGVHVVSGTLRTSCLVRLPYVYRMRVGALEGAGPAATACRHVSLQSLLIVDGGIVAGMRSRDPIGNAKATDNQVFARGAWFARKDCSTTTDSGWPLAEFALCERRENAHGPVVESVASAPRIEPDHARTTGFGTYLGSILELFDERTGTKRQSSETRGAARFDSRCRILRGVGGRKMPLAWSKAFGARWPVCTETFQRPIALQSVKLPRKA
ncbi:hypothetical protein B0H14DRAFT_2621383 [Mycena olivaceomarginata]|nr:hypothetical protein B0H14DRAFT_2621383 [Mycena olivaceomarginata]